MNRAAAYLALSGWGLQHFRRGLGLLSLLDALTRLSTAWLMLTDHGAFPRILYFTLYQDRLDWSLYFLSGSQVLTYLLLLLTILLSATQLLGYSRPQSRLFLWLLVFSVQVRNPLLNDSSDTLLRLMLFWDLFLPSEPNREDSYIAPATLAWQAQMSLALVGTAWGCTPAEWSKLPLRGEMVFFDPLWLAPLERAVFTGLLIAIWYRPARLLAVPLAGLLMVAEMLFIHPVFPLTLLVATLPLLPPKTGGALVAPGRRGKAAVAETLALLMIVVSGGLAALQPVAQLLGQEQDWSRRYPQMVKREGQIEVRPVGGGASSWTLSSEQSRRIRLWLDQLADNPLLGFNLARAAKFYTGRPEESRVQLTTVALPPTNETPQAVFLEQQ